MKKFFSIRQDNLKMDLTLLVTRLITGYAFIVHGRYKIQHPTDWMGNDIFPGFLEALAAVAEFGGGIALVLGVVSRFASLSIFATMCVAACLHAFTFGHPFVSKGGPSFEPAVMYMMISLFLTVAGPGRFSIDKKIFGIGT